MPKGLLFWVIWVICVVIWLGALNGFGGQYGHLVGGGVVEFVLFALLGWGIFGPPIQ
jgi:hypothetical protein